MKHRLAFILLMVFAVIQFSVIGSRIVTYENILETGKVWKLEVKPVDPYDILRGRFVRLRFKDDQFTQNMSGVSWKDRSAGFILLKKGKSGFTLPDRWVKDKPVDGGQDYVNCKVGGIYFAGRKHQNRVYYPFDRFFMNEYKAPAAEKVLRASFTKEHKVYITLRVKDGVGIIEELWVDQQTISDYLNSINMTSEKGL